jgi:hypothetical protein
MYKFNKVCIFCSNLQNGIDTFYNKKLSKLLSWHKDVIFITGCKSGCGAALSNYWPFFYKRGLFYFGV